MHYKNRNRTKSENKFHLQQYEDVDELPRRGRTTSEYVSRYEPMNHFSVSLER
jgi:hypothetical protein